MEELTIEQKAERYDKAIKVARSKIKNNKDHVLYEEDITDIFPELKQFENERIRKALISRFNESGELDGIPYNNIRIWLEKQGEPQVYETEDGKIITYSETDGYKVVEPKFNERKQESVDIFIEKACNYFRTKKKCVFACIGEDVYHSLLSEEEIENFKNYMKGE